MPPSSATLANTPDRLGMPGPDLCYINKSGRFEHKSSAAHHQLFYIQFHQVFKISVQLFLGKIGEKLRLGPSVYFTDALNQLPFTHSDILLNIHVAPQLIHIVSHNFFSLAHHPLIKTKVS
jgi:hypothetical protein